MTLPPRRARAMMRADDRCLRPLHHVATPCTDREFETRTSCELASCVLVPERARDAQTALTRLRASDLGTMSDALTLKRSGLNKAALAQNIVEQLRRGVARGTTLAGDACAATHAAARSEEAFGAWFVHVRRGHEEVFRECPSVEARDAARRALPQANGGSATAYYETDAARKLRAYLLYNASYDEVSLNVRRFLADIDVGQLLLRGNFWGETCWSSDPRVNRMVVDELYETRGGVVSSERPIEYSEVAKLVEEFTAQLAMRGPPHAAARPLPTPTGKSAGGATPSAPPPTAQRDWTEDPLLSLMALEMRATGRVTVPAASPNRGTPRSPATKPAPPPTKPATPPAATTTGKRLYSSNPTEQAFYERLEKADPMFEMVSPQINPAYPPGDVVKPQNVMPMKTFQQCFFLSQTELSFLQRENEFEMQVVSMLQNDDVKERMQWPLDVYLTANDHTLSVVKRSTVKSVTKSTRDPAVRIPVTRLRCGSNQIRMFHRDKRGAFMIALRIVRKRDIEDVASNIPAASSEAAALKNALKCLGFTKTDDEIIMEDVALVSLRCPISGQVSVDPARLATCSGLHSFDAKSYLQLNMVSRKWSCPECGKKGGPADLRVDGFLKRCTELIRSRGLSKVSRIEITKDGHWRPREDAGAAPLESSALVWYVPKTSNGAIEWTLDVARGSPASTATKVGGASGAATPNVESKETIALDAAAVNGDGDGDGDDDSELDEEEELKRAIREAAEFCGAKIDPTASAKRPSEPDVIVISDSEDDTMGTEHRASGGAHKRPKPSSALARNVYAPTAAARRTAPDDWLMNSARAQF